MLAWRWRLKVTEKMGEIQHRKPWHASPSRNEVCRYASRSKRKRKRAWWYEC